MKLTRKVLVEKLNCDLCKSSKIGEYYFVSESCILVDKNGLDIRRFCFKFSQLTFPEIVINYMLFKI